MTTSSKHHFKTLCAGAALCTAFLAPVHAQDTFAPPPGLAFELGAGGQYQPSFEGSSRYLLRATPLFKFGYLKFRNGFQLGGPDREGFRFKPSFRYLRQRSATEDPILAGLPNIDGSFEAGGGLQYKIDQFTAFAKLRYGVTGHRGFIGEAGFDWQSNPAEHLTLTFGPRLSFIDRKYASTYFGVTAAGAAASGFTQFAASGGLKSAGLEFNARYQLNDNWSVRSKVSWERLLGDAAASPITRAGDTDQYIFSIGLARKIQFNF